jgi:hypothetical protein
MGFSKQLDKKKEKNSRKKCGKQLEILNSNRMKIRVPNQ